MNEGGVSDYATLIRPTGCGIAGMSGYAALIRPTDCRVTPLANPTYGLRSNAREEKKKQRPWIRPRHPYSGIQFFLSGMTDKDKR